MEREGRLWWVWGLLCVGILVAWLPALQGPFVYDDRLEVVGNGTIQDLSQWQLILGYNWSRPLTIASYALNHAVHGPQVLGYHLVDLVLHMVSAGLALLTLREVSRILELERPLWFSAIGASMWALHPLQTESVSYIAGRSEQLAALLVLLGLWSWLRFLQAPGARREQQFLAWAAVCLAVFAKETGVVLVPLMAAADWLLLNRGQLRQVRWLRYVPGVVGIVAFFGLRLWLYGSLLSPAEPLRPLSEQLPTQSLAWTHYLRLALLPYGQSLFHDLPVHGLDGLTGLAMAAWLGALIAALGLSGRFPALSFALIAWALCLAPSSSIVALKETMAEHRVHLALLAPMSVLSGALLCGRERSGWARWVALGLTAGLLVLSFNRNTLWSSEVTLWQDAVAKNPESAEARYALGDARRLAGDPEGARKAYKAATRLDPTYAAAFNNLGLLELQIGGQGAAEQAWKQALVANPRYCPAHNNLGQLYMQQRKPRQAMLELNTTLSKCPQDCMAHRLLGALYEEHVPDRALAIRHYEAALEICPAASWSPDVRERLTRLTW